MTRLASRKSTSTSTGTPDPAGMGWTSPSGLHVEWLPNGSLRNMALGDINVNLFVGNALEGGPANLVLRLHGDTGTAIRSTPLLGPGSPTMWRIDTVAGELEGAGEWHGLHYRVLLKLSVTEPAWFWHVRIENAADATARFDLLYLQDLALAPYAAVRLNEYYVSQYLDHSPLAHAARGFVLASRQNQAVGTKHPWCVIGSLNRCVAYATDALQVQGLASRAGLPEPGLVDGLPAKRLQHEHAMAALQDAVCELAPGRSAELGWFGRLQADHPEPTSSGDLSVVDSTLSLPEAKAPSWRPDRPCARPEASLFATAPLLQALDLDDSALDAIFGPAMRHAERTEDGRLLGFFHGENSHVALRAKELAVLRPHGQVLRTGTLAVPDESALTSTVWMGGVFHSMLTQGHVSINRCLSTVRSYLGLFRSQGLRIFIEVEGTWRLLDQPSAFEMVPDACRWVYRHAGGRVDVRSRAHSDPHAFSLEVEVVEGPATRCLVCLHVALNGDDGSMPGRAHWTRDGHAVLLTPAPQSELGARFPQGSWRVEPSDDTAVERVCGDEALFPDGRARDLPYLTLTTAPARAARFMLLGRFVEGGPDVPAADAVAATARLASTLDVQAPADSVAGARLGRLMELMPWLRQNALIHYLAPRGLEQFSGGGWGTRDVCQGPVELLLADGNTAPMRDLLLRVMKAQRTDGDWPQWFMFFERDAAIRADDSHGDIVFWPLLALGQYLIASGDASILLERVPFHPLRASRPGAAHSVWEHVLRALALTRKRIIAGTALAAYGHGDWNDSLQPANSAMREHMCSAWTVTLHHQTLTTLALALRRMGRVPAAMRLERQAAAVRGDFSRLLLVDDVLAGYALFGEGEGEGDIHYLLHPRDRTTGVRYSILAMIHAILEGLFDPTQMRHHLRLIDEHLSGPDGARLFDRPLQYHGGTQRHFQRAESATFFGREIGLMYMHAHLRYAQALAHVGDAERFFHALCQANPIGLGEIVPTAGLRPSNSYYSSSDARFVDRYQASDEYGRVRAGTIELDGGWRVYSSGAGILFSLVVRHLFGLRLEADALLIDPVLPAALDGTRVRVTLLGRDLDIVYRVVGAGSGVRSLQLDGRRLEFVVEANPYRRGAARVLLHDLNEPRAGSPRCELLVSVGE
jgi:cellobiose phosphorylase